MFKYVRVQIRKSETTSVTKEVPPWEVAVLAAVNGGDCVVELGETPVDRALPDPSAEYDRLALKYKVDTATGVAYVAAVYGAGRRGVVQLAQEIERARAAAESPAVRTEQYDAGDDPLAGLFDEGLSESAGVEPIAA